MTHIYLPVRLGEEVRKKNEIDIIKCVQEKK